jgi:hypothetical protein
MKLAHAGESGLEHLGEGERRDRLELLRVHPLDEPVHELAPGPEAVLLGAPPLRQARDRPLKSVAVQVAEAGQTDAVALIAGGRIHSRLERAHGALAHRDPHSACPPGRQQDGVEPERLGSQNRRPTRIGMKSVG